MLLSIWIFIFHSLTGRSLLERCLVQWGCSEDDTQDAERFCSRILALGILQPFSDCIRELPTGSDVTDKPNFNVWPSNSCLLLRTLHILSCKFHKNILIIVFYWSIWDVFFACNDISRGISINICLNISIMKHKPPLNAVFKCWNDLNACVESGGVSCAFFLLPVVQVRHGLIWIHTGPFDPLEVIFNL